MSNAARAAIWSAMLIIVRTLGREWGYCENIIVQKSANSEALPITPHGADVATAAVYNHNP